MFVKFKIKYLILPFLVSLMMSCTTKTCRTCGDSYTHNGYWSLGKYRCGKWSSSDVYSNRDTHCSCECARASDD